MKLLAISEHYFPRIGGTVNYVHETLCALANLGVETELLVPGPIPDGWLSGSSPPSYRVSWVEAGYPARGEPSREQRYDYCRQVARLALEKANGPDRPDLLHVLFGLFVMETLDSARLRDSGLPCIATVHNVPPMECRQVSQSAPLLARIRETLRLKAVALKNQGRLKKHKYDLYVVPSQQVYRLLEPIVRGTTAVIGHGPTSDLLGSMTMPATRRPAGPVRLLTVGGYAPHKRQHIIPATAVALREANLDFRWDVVGPSGRVSGYFDSISRDVLRRGLEERVILQESVPFTSLARLYEKANLYVQPSIEEGFCITALDAAAAGIPVIASPAGALSQIAEASGGALVASFAEVLASTIVEFVQADRWADPLTLGQAVRARFSWNAAAATLRDRYSALLERDASFG